VTGLAIRARRLRDRVVTVFGNRPLFAVTLAVVRRDIEVGGTLLAGALGFRLFIWLLPCCLLATAALGFTASSSRPPAELVNDLGMSPLTASMVGQLSEQAARGRWVTALIGLVLLAWAGLTLARAFDRVHDRVWGHRLDRAPKQALARAARYNLALLLVVLANMAGPVVSAALGRPPAVVSLPSLAMFTLFGIILLSPEWPPRWRSAWPGAVLIALGAEGLHLVAVVYLPGKLARSSELYGALGVAAVILVWLALITRLIVLGQVLDAVLAERARSVDPTTHL
jgi:membrane protein